MTKICIFGAGSIGGYIAACLKKTDAEISLVARGPHKKAIEENGLTFIKNENTENYKIKVTDDVRTLGPQDYIFLSIKAHGISNIVSSLNGCLLFFGYIQLAPRKIIFLQPFT